MGSQTAGGAAVGIIEDSPMNQTAPIAAPPAGRCLLLSDVDWKTYTRLLRVFAERPGIRLTYDRGELEIMAPLIAHDDDADFLGDLVFLMTLELGLPIKRGGSVTLRRRLRQRGLEADRCYWVTNAQRLGPVRKLDLSRHPPPDIAIEVDLTHSSLDRLAIYADLGVPEVWRLAGDVLTFHVLDGGSYSEAAASRLFPFVTPADMLGYVQRARQTNDENSLIPEFQAWVRQHRTTKP
jgi:Uma2 family endonuclease